MIPKFVRNPTSAWVGAPRRRSRGDAAVAPLPAKHATLPPFLEATDWLFQTCGMPEILNTEYSHLSKHDDDPRAVPAHRNESVSGWGFGRRRTWQRGTPRTPLPTAEVAILEGTVGEMHASGAYTAVSQRPRHQDHECCGYLRLPHSRRLSSWTVFHLRRCALTSSRE